MPWTGDLWEAASACDYGRRLDLADRCINCKTTKYLFRAGRIEEAERIVVLFSKVRKTALGVVGREGISPGDFACVFMYVLC